MSDIFFYPPKIGRQIAGSAIAKVLLVVALLHAIFLMQPKNDTAQDIRRKPPSQPTKQAVDMRPLPHFSPVSEDMDAATRATFTSPSPQYSASALTESAFNQVAPIPTMSGAALLQLPFERGEIGEEALSALKIDNLLAEDDLPLRIYEYESQSRSDTDASELTWLYRQVVERAMIASRTRARIEGFACGLRICVGLLADGNDQDYWDWRDAFALSPELSGAGMREVILKPEGRSAMLRFAFSVAPHPILSE